MDLYHFALFLHLLTLIVAAAVTAITKVAAGRRAAARTVDEMLEWHRVLTSASTLYPVCLAAFTVTGAYMLVVAHMNAWASGFVIAGLTGVILLHASGIPLGVAGKKLQRILEALAETGGTQSPPRLAAPFLITALPMINTGLALAIVYDMVMKPTVPVALGVLAAGMALGALRARRGQQPVRATSSTARRSS
jgi:hypothetical protein